MLWITDKDRKRFWSKVNKDGPIHPEYGQCWEWIGVTKEGRYAQVGIQGKNYFVHRLSYIEEYGKIPEGLLVCHKCDNKICVNPEHLFLGTHQDNTDDAYEKGRQQVSPKRGMYTGCKVLLPSERESYERRANDTK